MRARAPGKLVLSGAYAVLDGAPGLVAAVDRYVIAESGRRAEFVTPEVRAAIGERAAPWFDATALRSGEQKLGLGSSAAILVASLAALELQEAPQLSPSLLAERVFPTALRAHAQAQGGGSGIDVAASAFGGVLRAERREGELLVHAVSLPREVHIRVLALGRPASTPELIARVRALAARNRALYDRCMAAQHEASERAAEAIESADAQAFVASIASQAEALFALGEAAGAPIVTPELRTLHRRAREQGGAVIPSGAGGGDVALEVTCSSVHIDVADAITPIALTLGAPGVHAVA